MLYLHANEENTFINLTTHAQHLKKKKTTLQSDKRQPNTESAASSDNIAKQQNANTKVQPNIGCLKVV